VHVPRLLPIFLWFCAGLILRAGDFDEALDRIAPELKKWATVCVVTDGADGKPAFAWSDYRETGQATDFWPASTIKLYTVIAAVELLNEKGFPLETTTATFEHREGDGPWILDAARGMREMISEVFRRSSNEDYTLLLRLCGIDRINTQFLTPERGFPHSALMRGYVAERPWAYRIREPQRITLRTTDGKTETFEHTWSGHSYAADRGEAIFDRQTGNLTSPRELAECLRRVMFHEHLVEAERYRLTGPQVEFIRRGGNGFTGMETKAKDSYGFAWTTGVETVFPKARFFHKSGLISSYALEVAYVEDEASGRRFLFVPVVRAGSATKPVSGEKLISEMSRVLSGWVKER
jgi:hypothetical protein